MDHMTITMDQIRQIADIIGLEEDDLRTSYSGRGMYGATCLGFVGSESELSSVQFEIAAALLDQDMDPDMSAWEAVDTLRDMMHEVGPGSLDSMGRSVIRYWPRIRVQD